MTAATILHEGLAFGEGPRWRDGVLWFSDFYRRAVYTLAPDGTETKIVDVPAQPSGLGWLPDGRLLVSSMRDHTVLRLEPDGSLALHADLSDLADYHLNDLITDATGRAYVGNFGYDLHADMAERDVPTILADEGAGATRLARVDPDGTVSVAAEGVRFPNGMAWQDDGRTLVLAETLRLQLTAYDVAADGTLSAPRVWASTAPQMVGPGRHLRRPRGRHLGVRRPRQRRRPLRRGRRGDRAGRDEPDRLRLRARGTRWPDPLCDDRAVERAEDRGRSAARPDRGRPGRSPRRPGARRATPG